MIHKNINYHMLILNASDNHRASITPVRLQYKVGRVIGSCQTPEQMEVAKRYQKLAMFPCRQGDKDLMSRALDLGFDHVHVLPPKPLPTSEADRQRNAAYAMPAAGGRTILVSKEANHDFSEQEQVDLAYRIEAASKKRLMDGLRELDDCPNQK